MNVVKSLELLRKYGTCQDCGNARIGDGQGTLNIEDDTFTRTCKCGWSIEVKGEDE